MCAAALEANGHAGGREHVVDGRRARGRVQARRQPERSDVFAQLCADLRVSQARGAFAAVPRRRKGVGVGVSAAEGLFIGRLRPTRVVVLGEDGEVVGQPAAVAAGAQQEAGDQPLPLSRDFTRSVVPVQRIGGAFVHDRAVTVGKRFGDFAQLDFGFRLHAELRAADRRDDRAARSAPWRDSRSRSRAARASAWPEARLPCGEPVRRGPSGDGRARALRRERSRTLHRQGPRDPLALLDDDRRALKQACRAPDRMLARCWTCTSKSPSTSSTIAGSARASSCWGRFSARSCSSARAPG